MKGRLYFDENFPVRVAPLLRDLGYDVRTAHEAGQGNRGIADRQVLEFAISEQRALLTGDRDFARVHTELPQHFGILLCSQMPPEDLTERIHKALVQHPDLRGQLLRITRLAR